MLKVSASRAAPFVCAGINAAAALALVAFLRPGTELVDSPTERAAFITSHPVTWRVGWGLWMAAALSLLWFYAWWGARLASRRKAMVAWLVAAVGAVCDLTAESLYIGWLPERMDELQRLGSLLTGGVANGLYTVSGVMLTLATPTMPGWLRTWAWTVWISGFALSLFTFLGSSLGMAVAAGVLMALFCPWAAAMGWKLR